MGGSPFTPYIYFGNIRLRCRYANLSREFDSISQASKIFVQKTFSAKTISKYLNKGEPYKNCREDFRRKSSPDYFLIIMVHNLDFQIGGEAAHLTLLFNLTLDNFIIRI